MVWYLSSNQVRDRPFSLFLITPAFNELLLVKARERAKASGNITSGERRPQRQHIPIFNAMAAASEKRDGHSQCLLVFIVCFFYRSAVSTSSRYLTNRSRIKEREKKRLLKQCKHCSHSFVYDIKEEWDDDVDKRCFYGVIVTPGILSAAGKSSYLPHSLHAHWENKTNPQARRSHEIKKKIAACVPP